MKLQNKTILITGASSGIGKAMALRSAMDGATVIISARNIEKLNRVAKEIENLGGKAIIIPCDITNADSIKSLFLKATENSRVIDVVFANAGLGYISELSQLKTTQIKTMVDTNIFGTITTVKYATEVMTRQKYGHVVITSSLAGLITLPEWSVYVASKWAITGLADCIRPELKKSNVLVTTLHPGAVSTEFFDKDKANIDINSASGGVKPVSAEEVAASVYNALFTNKKRILVPGMVKTFSFLYRIFPGLVSKLIENMTKNIKYHKDSNEDETDFDFIKPVSMS